MVSSCRRLFLKQKCDKRYRCRTFSLRKVGITGLEPATSRPPDVCATNCAKSRFLQHLTPVEPFYVCSTFRFICCVCKGNEFDAYLQIFSGFFI